MKIRSIYLDPNDDDIVLSADVSVTLDELALVYRVFGSVSPAAVTDATGSPALTAALDTLCGGCVSVFNRFYDCGIDDIAPRFDAGDLVDAQRRVVSERS